MRMKLKSPLIFNLGRMGGENAVERGYSPIFNSQNFWQLSILGRSSFSLTIRQLKLERDIIFSIPTVFPHFENKPMIYEYLSFANQNDNIHSSSS